ncbi:Ca2+/Na+ antiporter [Breznakia sp. PF5-3]|uniref:hypothetical protein n=1 Tax=unclassified Breznakia TaxID=2623764 RepID=UPI0024065EFD|nr:MULTISPECIES: hypothetical protein [unclassified Breznakia]MDF9825610.1 Ca2+/Na+ antiporter [Breznakia sp. PM6-1]MDF9836447.1 Ca2+/Na+ antiporter [Breznakia sp. PF5-3]MDF9838351.1 Ca2+/Na+ antiporter [Breznakia sp. PFB2-8]MDF9860357.1 Ca2+/Na+ antiporter [Breznakia sp. PH5-24]
MSEKEKTMIYIKSKLKSGSIYTIVFTVAVLLMSLLKLDLEVIVSAYIVILCAIILAFNFPKRKKSDGKVQYEQWDGALVNGAFIINMIWSIYLLVPPFVFFLVSGI